MLAERNSNMMITMENLGEEYSCVFVVLFLQILCKTEVFQNRKWKVKIVRPLLTWQALINWNLEKVSDLLKVILHSPSSHPFSTWETDPGRLALGRDQLIGGTRMHKDGGQGISSLLSSKFRDRALSLAATEALHSDSSCQVALNPLLWCQSSSFVPLVLSVLGMASASAVASTWVH